MRARLTHLKHSPRPAPPIAGILILVACLAAPSARAAEESSAPAAEPPAFAVLKQHCGECHAGPEAKRGLVLIDAAGIARGSKRGRVLTPGNPDQSPLWQRVAADEMPPETPLSAEEKEVLRAWIAEGAPGLAEAADAPKHLAGAPHWAFVPPVRPALPEVARPEWSVNPIDRFVLERLQKEGLEPSPAADRTTLLRRLSLDLTGLPPSPEEIARVEADASDGWYAAWVDRLLASPHYGERWARHWMDAAQYADSDGFEKDKPRQVWAWRDWVIGALNRNLPYDQFVVEQVAGDLLPGAGQDQIVATGFLRNSMINEEGGIDPEQFRMEAQFNRMDIIGRAVLGLTIQCAQCHTHKYDPLTHTEYYRLQAFLNNANEACVTVLTEDEARERDSILKLVSQIEERIKSANPDWHERAAAWEAKTRDIPKPRWEPLELAFDDSSAGGQKCIPQGDFSYLAQGYAPTQHQPKMTAATKLAKITAVRIELLPDPNLPRGGPGRSVYGSAALSEFEMRTAAADTPIADYDKWTVQEVASAVADVNPPVRQLGADYPTRGKEEKRVTGGIAFAIDKKSETAWTTDVDPIRRNEKHEAIFVFAKPVEIATTTTLAFRLSQQHGGWNSDDNQNNNLGRFRISVTDAEALPDRVLPERVSKAVEHFICDRDERQLQSIFAAWRAEQPDLADENARIQSLLQAIPSGATQLVMNERAAPRETRRLDRGNFLAPAEKVEPGVPAFLHPMEGEGSADRLALARWLVSRKSPTTARAFVNRVWQQYFGQGLVATASDFGTQGDAPSHPELLDWLAVEFMDSGWDVKRLHRLIVSSMTFRQASRVSPELLERDPQNRLLARGARFRLEGEVVRDVALSAAGLLNPAMGGPSVYPPAPEYLFQPPASYGPKTWRMEQGAGKYRRGIYTFRFRSVPYPALQVFDTPPGDAPCTRRVRSNTPLQALTTLNEPLFVACAGGLAQYALTEAHKGDRAGIEAAFRRCVARAPEEPEAATLEMFLVKQRARLAAGELNAAAILRGAGAEAAGARDPAELAAWTLVARAILNLDETITRE